MDSRVSQFFPESAPAPQSPAFGLVAWLEQTRVHLPLKGVETRFTITGDVAEVEIDQVFINHQAASLDVTYTFPLPAAASVYRCEMLVNGRVVAAVAEEADRARQIFDEAKRDGHRAALVETVRDNLFTLSLGNVPPREVIVIRLAYLQELERMVRTVALRIPVCPGVRYIPGRPLLRSNSGRGTVDDTDQVPDASQLSPPRIDALHPDAASFHVCGRLARDEVGAHSLVSPSHPIAVRDGGSGPLVVGLADGSAVPDRDFFLRWEQPPLNAGAGVAFTTTAGDDTFALVRLAAPAPAAPTVAAACPRDLWLLVDRSGSMQGEKWTQTCRALSECVAMLRDDDRVFLTLFESGFRHFAEKPLLAATLRADPNFHGLVQLGTGGGTHLLPALVDLLAKFSEHRDAARPAHCMILTDGQIGNEAEVIRRLAAHPDLRMHTIGIDTAVNDAFLQRLARDHGGRCVLVSPRESVLEAVQTVVGGLGEPVVRDVHWPAGFTAPDTTAPASLFGDQHLTLVLRGCSGESRLVVRGTLAEGAAWSCAIAPQVVASAAPRLLWAKRAINLALRENRRADAVALAKEHNLLCDGVSFIAVDRTTKVPVAQDHLYQPALVHEVHSLACAMHDPVSLVRHSALFERAERPESARFLHRLSRHLLPSDADETPVIPVNPEAEALFRGILALLQQIDPYDLDWSALANAWVEALLAAKQALAEARAAMSAAAIDDNAAASLLFAPQPAAGQRTLERRHPELKRWRKAAARELAVFEEICRIVRKAGGDPDAFAPFRQTLLPPATA